MIVQKPGFTGHLKNQTWPETSRPIHVKVFKFKTLLLPDRSGKYQSVTYVLHVPEPRSFQKQIQIAVLRSTCVSVNENIARIKQNRTLLVTTFMSP